MKVFEIMLYEEWLTKRGCRRSIIIFVIFFMGFRGVEGVDLLYGVRG